MIDTGDDRSVTGHTISGAVASAVVAGSINYGKYKKDEISYEEAVSDSIKLTAQGAIATGSAIAAANSVGNNNAMGFLTAISMGIMGVYAIEQISQKLQEKNERKLIQEKK